MVPSSLIFAFHILQFVTNEDVKILRDIEQYYSTQIDEVSGAASQAFDLPLLTLRPADARQPWRHGLSGFLQASI